MAVTVLCRRWSQKPPPGVGVNRSSPIAAGLIAQYLFNEGGGNLVRDTASLGIYDGLNNASSITWGRGRSGSALVGALTTGAATGQGFDFGLPSLTAFTVEVWIYPTASDDYGTLLTDGSTAGLWYRGSTNKVDYYFTTDHLSTATAPLNTWTHFVLRQDAAGAWAMYFNAKADASGTGAPARTFTFLFNDNASDTFAGSMDLLRLWNRPLAEGEIEALFADPFCVVAPVPTLRLLSPPSGAPSPPVGRQLLVSQAVNRSALW